MESSAGTVAVYVETAVIANGTCPKSVRTGGKGGNGGKHTSGMCGTCVECENGTYPSGGKANG